MKKIILGVLLMLFTNSLMAQQKEAILKVLHNLTTNWNKGDLDAFMQGYWKSDSVLFVSPTVPVKGWQNTLNLYKKSYPGHKGMGKLSFKIFKVDILDPNYAFVYGQYHLIREKDAPTGYFTLLFKKINGKWVVVVDHSS